MNYFSVCIARGVDRYIYDCPTGLQRPRLFDHPTSIGVIPDVSNRDGPSRGQLTNHLSVLNRLYLSTIETLAMAIDAKDQITHGHIRRVQSYAVGLARKDRGVSDDKLLKAIEAAALLHDMGKLAVPEHILNKPGKLLRQRNEEDEASCCASVGADILSAIQFPYPVVPIVRHHHENWNGTGYPDRNQGHGYPDWRPDTLSGRLLRCADVRSSLPAGNVRCTSCRNPEIQAQRSDVRPPCC